MLRKAWHHPILGPIILISLGFPAILMLLVSLWFPIFVVVELLRPLKLPGYVPFSRASTAYLLAGVLTWFLFFVYFLSTLRQKRFRFSKAFTVNTDRFNSTERKANFINPNCFGEDFIHWLKIELEKNTILKLSDAIQEDYGWGFWATDDDGLNLWVCIGMVETQGKNAEWNITVDYEPSMNPIKRLTQVPDEKKRNEFVAKLSELLDLL